MKVLITSGGTKVPIDQVRDITNLSSGTFGTKIARQFLLANHHVHFFKAKDSKSPFKYTYDFAKQTHDFIKSSNDFLDFVKQRESQYQESTYRNFDDYQSGLWKAVDEYQPDMLILAAAVSDYGVEAVDGKIRSEDQRTIELFPYPKLISEVKVRYPDLFLAGFKLLVNSTEEDLFSAIRKSIQSNGCDLVVGNDLRDIKQGQHQLMIGVKGFDEVTIHKDRVEVDYLAKVVMKKVVSCKINKF